MTARIYKPAKTAMQSGQAKTKAWVLDFEPEAPRTVEPLMGWTSSGDMRQQVRLRFASKEEAVAYCERHGIAYQVSEETPHSPARHVLFGQFRVQAPRRLDPLTGDRRAAGDDVRAISQRARPNVEAPICFEVGLSEAAATR